MVISSGMSGMREIQRQVITQMHALNPARRVKVDVSTLSPSKAGNITVWTFRKAENEVIIENILKVVSVPPEGIPKESVPGVVMNVVQMMINEKLLEEIPPRMILTDDQVTAMKDNDYPVSWNTYLRMSWTEKRDIGKATKETPEQRVQRVNKVKGEAEQKRKDKADKKAESDRLHAPGIARRARNAAKPLSARQSRARELQSKQDKANASTKKYQSQTVEEVGGMVAHEESAMRSNPYFL